MSNLHYCHKCPFVERIGSHGQVWVCAKDAQKRWIAEMARDVCPQGFFTEPDKMPPNPHVGKPSFPNVWKWVHMDALTHLTGEEIPGWIEKIAMSVSCGDCRNSFRTWVKDHPPRWNELFTWTVELHNYVNKKLGKPEWDLAQAFNHYSRETT